MTTIRKQSIISSGIVYIGLGLGIFTNYLLARKFTPDQYGLVSGMFVAIGTVIYCLGAAGMTNFVGKFYPYYKDNLSPRKNDLLSLALLVCLAGCMLTVVAGVVFKGAVVRFFSDRSSELVYYYFWIFPFGLGMAVYAVLEQYAWQVKRSVLTNYLREVQLRLTTLVLIVLYLTGILGGFSNFVKLYALNYLLISLILLTVLLRSGEFHPVFSISRVTKKFFRKIRSLALLGWGGGVLFNLAFYFAQIVIAGLVAGGLTAVGIFQLAQFGASLIQAPQRGVSAASMGPLAQAWKRKDYGRIGRIYKRSSINQLLFGMGMFVLIWINYRDGIVVLHLNNDYLLGQWAFFFIGLARVIDLGTGVNSQIIYTSVHYRVEIISGVVLLTLTIPLNYWLAKEVGLTGPAIADFITFLLYNAIRCLFLYRRYKLQPFGKESVYGLLLALAGWVASGIGFGHLHGLIWMIIRSFLFLLIYGGGILVLRLSEDILPVWATVKKRFARLSGRLKVYR